MSLGFLGHLFLLFACVASLLLAIIPAVVTKPIVLRVITLLPGCFITLAFCVLITGFVTSDFSLELVARNSHTLKPLLYKFTGTWGNHEGSILLFVMLSSWYLSSFGLTASLNDKSVHATCRYGALLLGTYLAYVLLTSDPFMVLHPPAIEGIGLNPLLQDIGLAIHPPVLYLGYTGLSICFLIVLGHLSLGSNVSPTALAKSLRPYALWSFSFLTLGIGLGAWWAYRELGWGGFWFFDPVENASLLPWLSSIAMIHSIRAVEQRGRNEMVMMSFTILTFLLSLLGLFLVRSGILTSVHSFAVDPSRGVVLLLMLALFGMVGFLALFQYRPEARQRPAPTFFSRETSFNFHYLLISTLLFTIILGLLYPLLLEVITNEKISVGAPYYIQSFIPLGLVTILFAGMGSLIVWGNDRFKRLITRYLGLTLVSLLITFGITAITTQAFSWLGSIGCFAGSFILCSSAYTAISKRSSLNPSLLSMVIAHSGIGIITLAISIHAIFAIETERVIREHQVIDISDHKIRFDSVSLSQKDNYISQEARFSVTPSHGNSYILTPELRLFLIEETETTEAAIRSTFGADMYLAIGAIRKDGNLPVRVYYKPGVLWIWIGVLVTAIGGLIPVCYRCYQRIRV